VDADQDFETFLREWTDERIWANDGFLDDCDKEYMVKRRAIELIQVAKEKGFGDALMDTARPYGGVLEYVKRLLWEADFAVARSRDESGNA
jgi:hypothetical protein